ncbi:AtpZ/AtpI family protein [Desulfovibrio oxyclinae]|uniref:AtpZ/AtpI family protein n=1 Tax=Desulfovibrio oxyclinae TaxID=63560 RepID=UPI00039C83A9|nr:AtpZ/AtpI family protein [Desulfovibrio oxyclinae]
MFFKKDRLQDMMKVGGPAGVLGFHIVSSTFVGLAMGYFLGDWLDETFGWGVRPWMIIIFLILGIVAGFRMVFQDLKKIERQEERGRESLQKRETEDGDADDPGA